jgi:hypothetical protein
MVRTVRGVAPHRPQGGPRDGGASAPTLANPAYKGRNDQHEDRHYCRPGSGTSLAPAASDRVQQPLDSEITE